MRKFSVYAVIMVVLSALGTGCQSDSVDELEVESGETEVLEDSQELAEEESQAESEDYVALREDFYAPFQPLPSVPGSVDALPEGVNPVQLEMQLLTEGMQNILRLIADHRLEEVAGQIRQVHPAYELTHQAIEAGLYRPPQNGDQLEGFVAMDDAFHDDLRALLRASRENDIEAAAQRYGELVEGCVSCHAVYRFPSKVEE